MLGNVSHKCNRPTPQNQQTSKIDKKENGLKLLFLYVSYPNYIFTDNIVITN